MTRKLALLAVLGMATAGTASAQWVGVIETRQAGLDLLAGDFAGIRAVVAAKGDVKTLEDPAKAIARWIKQLPTLFPAGTEQGHDTKALPAIWSDTAGFQKAAGNLAEAIRAVVAAKGDVKTLENSGEGDGALDQAVPDAVPDGQRAGPRHQGAAGDLVRHRRVPEGGQRSGSAPTSWRSSPRPATPTPWPRRSRSWATPARRATGPIARADTRPPLPASRERESGRGCA